MSLSVFHSCHHNAFNKILLSYEIEDQTRCNTCLSDFSCESEIEWITLNGYAHNAVNTVDHAPVSPARREGAIVTNQDISFILPKASWNMIRLRLKK